MSANHIFSFKKPHLNRLPPQPLAAKVQNNYKEKLDLLLKTLYLLHKQLQIRGLKVFFTLLLPFQQGQTSF